ncbi:MAG: hypothetical protein K2P12_01000, partial [Clostridia bacterium]|nr:hypothetical protein [Clostridia bacterium]
MKKIYYRNTKPKKKVKLANFNGVSEDWYSKNAPVDFAVKQENLMTQNGSLVESLSPESTGVQFESKILKVIPYYEDSTKLLVICEYKSY